MKILQTKELRKTYGKITAVNKLDLTIEKGMIYGLLGPNGSGKTTTLGIILGVLKQDSGTYTWFKDANDESHRIKLGAILETPNFYPYLDAIDNLQIVSKIKKVENPNIDYLLELVNLSARKKSKFRTYSLGMKQRLAIAATMLGNPEVLIFDEPTNGLDPQGIIEVRHILQQIASTGKTVIMASHILDEVEKICSHVGIMKFGNLLASGPIGSILNDDLLIELGSSDLEKLKTVLSEFSFVKISNVYPNFIECTIQKDINSEYINKLLSDKGIYLNHLVLRKQRLEEEFLQITSNEVKNQLV